MNFRDFLMLFKDCDHPWGDLAGDALRDPAWNGTSAKSLLSRIPPTSPAYDVFQQVQQSYLLFSTGSN
mgnify:CR=1 FL=1